MLFSSLVCVKADKTSADISEYTDNEIFVMYNDDSFEIISFNDENDFNLKINELAENKNVLLFQPNYKYESTAFSNDPFIKKQWALENDGSFSMENYKNEHPVFDSPFGKSFSPREWVAPDIRKYFPYRNTGYSVPSKAVSGIDINLNPALDLYRDSGRKIIIAMIDTGIDYTHQELSGRIWKNSGEIEYNGIDDDRNGYVDDIYGWNFYDNNNRIYSRDEDSHGTHGAGTIIAKRGNNTGISGIVQSPNIKVMSVKALGGNNGSGSTASVISAIKYAEKNGAEICNLSLGTSYNDSAIYNTLANSKMLFVISAGNDGENTDYSPCYPASYNLDNIISVANLTYDGTLNYSSNYGLKSVDIAAPGSYILSTTLNNDYGYMSGTSMSAPFVSAAAALVYSHYPQATLSDVKKIILSSSAKLASLRGVVATGGMLNLENALKYYLNDNDSPQETPFEYKGSSPVIKTSFTNSFPLSDITLNVYDEDNDVVYISYANGYLSTDYFRNGNKEIPIQLNGNSCVFKIPWGKYTFFALDSKGNVTVHSVTVENIINNKPEHREKLENRIKDMMKKYFK